MGVTRSLKKERKAIQKKLDVWSALLGDRDFYKSPKTLLKKLYNLEDLERETAEDSILWGPDLRPEVPNTWCPYLFNPDTLSLKKCQ